MLEYKPEKDFYLRRNLLLFFFLRTELECSCSFHLGPPINQGSRMHFFLLLSIAHYDSRKVQPVFSIIMTQGRSRLLMTWLRFQFLTSNLS